MATSKKTPRSSGSSPAKRKNPPADGRRPPNPPKPPKSHNDRNDGAMLVTTDIEAIQGKAIDFVTAQMPSNPLKPFEIGNKNAIDPRAGEPVGIDDPALSASSAAEANENDKTGAPPVPGTNITTEPLTRVRADSSGQVLTTNQGVRVADNQNSLKAGLRGPTLMEDFILREKITHFDHERIPERIVHARGSGAHGFFECYEPMTRYTKAAPFQAAGKQTPVFVRFSTVAGERGSKDTARDARGFAVKFYTDEGNWDLVGNNIPVFFIQDAMKFPDLIHAVKPEPHHGMPQAASAHDTFWDFVSLMPESTHMLMWVMSDRAIPRSLRMMQGFGVHTFRLVNEKNESVFCKFHWTPKLGVHSLTWEEAVKISGADPDYHRRDLWTAIESGEYPEWELALQIFTEEQAEHFSFDVLDATKLIPEELIPLMPVGRMVLNRNPDNFFAETEQVAFCTAHVVPGIDFSNDPLLAGRIHSYVDTQITRLGGPNFHEIPINAPVAAVHNNQRDGMHRQTINRGRVSYEPNSLGGGCPFQAGAAMGFRTFPSRSVEESFEDKVRGKPEKFAEHYLQARLFFESMSRPEQLHIAGAFRFELSKVTVPSIRERMLSSLANASTELATMVADGLGMPLPDPMPLALTTAVEPEVEVSPALSQLSLPGEMGIRTRQVAILVADGIEQSSIAALKAVLDAEGAVTHFVGPRIGKFTTDAGGVVEANKSMENSPSVLFDALVLPDGMDAVATLALDGHTMEFVKDTFRHLKTILALGASSGLLDAAGITALAEGDPGVVIANAGSADSAARSFVAALTEYKHFARETDPPAI